MARKREKMSDADRCPSKATLEAFVVGDVAADEIEHLAEHLKSCKKCESGLEALDGYHDDLLAEICGISECSDEPAETLPADLLAAAESAYEEVHGGQGRHAAIDAGRSMALALADGSYRLGRFELLEELGAGAFGNVFRARDTELDRIVAIKVLRSSSLSSGKETERFLREARSAAQLKHPNIVALYDTGQTADGVLYLVTEYVSGETLEQHLQKTRFEPQAAARFVSAVAEALHYAHGQGVIHRDIKPANLMLDLDGQPHIMDFGLAKREADEASMTQAGDVMGTPAYMSPEQARGEGHHVDANTDTYSLGAVLYELLTGERPFQGNRRMIMLAVLEEEPRPPRKLNDGIPRDLETICLKAMAKAPGRRYETIKHFADDLLRYLHGEAIHARRIGPVERLGRWCRRNPVAASLMIAVFLGPAVGLVHLSRLSGALLEKTALQSAAMHADVLDRMNALYSSAVANPMRDFGVVVTHDFHKKECAIPLPATFTIALGEDMSDSKYGMQLRLYSDYPFRTRTDGGPRDAFERRALADLRKNPTKPVHQFEDYDGQYSLRYATARRMGESCVSCHNSHPDSTKTDWKVGDVRGVLEIIHPLERDVVRTRRALRGTFLLVGLISGAFFFLAVGAVVAGNRRRSQRFLGANRW